MKKVIISNPTDFEGEIDIIEQLLSDKTLIFHLRKPEKSKDELTEFLQKISPKFYRQIVVHSHHDLLKKYNLKGVHFTEKMREQLPNDDLISMAKTLRKRGLTVSFSLHSLEAIEQLPCKADYVFLSPIFQSISKPDYPSAFSIEILKQFFKNRISNVPVLALGGVNNENIEIVQTIGFQGYALMGSVWKIGQISN
ncbi:thiamine-phosphate pyrophosphorylase [Arcicella aurantiaca]|uniref:Thiamine-phosphate pyrophosphorylase n=1 Tax=Arcicella aurantiaca TaxID=591202 RepID=A0A316E2N6_9BACT|nr:thiamine phosphate synthase [Arcicella aurantiaca]PWK23822.1 thiamine-phosphate pyrophosphorylase [Arcicella aurantiaca]